MTWKNNYHMLSLIISIHILINKSVEFSYIVHAQWMKCNLSGIPNAQDQKQQ